MIQATQKCIIILLFTVSLTKGQHVGDNVTVDKEVNVTTTDVDEERAEGGVEERVHKEQGVRHGQAL